MKWVIGGGPFDREVKALFDRVNLDELWDLPKEAQAIVQKLVGDSIKVTRLHHNPSYGSGRSISILGRYNGHGFMVRLWDDDSSYRYLPDTHPTDHISDQGRFNV